MTKDKWLVLGVFLALVVALIAFSQTRPLDSTAVPAPAADPDGATQVQPAEQPAAKPHDTEVQAGEHQAEYEKWVTEEFPRRIEGDPLALGALDAPVVMTQWADYRCPFCSVFAEETMPQLQRYVDDGTLRIEFRDLALFGDESVRAATAARAAGEQGKFWEFQHALFAATPNEGHPDIPDDLVLGLVTDLGLDAARFQEDWADATLHEAVVTDSQEAQGLGVTATPAFVIGTQFMTGARPLPEFERIIEGEAAKLG